MTKYRFSWDPKKAETNVRDHDGVTFEEAATAFEDPLAEFAADKKHAERTNVLGMSTTRLLFVVAVETVDDEEFRIISARLADRRERKRYEEGK